MTYSTTVGVDLAKNVIQISVVSGRGKELSNRSLTRKRLAEFLGRQKQSLVAFESCATAHYWARAAQRHGHEVRIIPAKAVTPFRQGHKTDSNDALAVAEAARRPNIKEAPMKTIEQQGLQAIHRSRELLNLGARAYTYKLREPKSSKDKWLTAIIERNGESRAAVALANKNVTTAWAMVTQGTEYQRRPQLEMPA